MKTDVETWLKGDGGVFIKEIAGLSFRLERKSLKRLIHDESFDEGYILNFRKGSPKIR